MEENFVEFFRTLGNKFIAGGDYNCKNSLWRSRLTTTKGRELSKLIQNPKYSFLTRGTPTYWPSDPGKIPICWIFISQVASLHPTWV
jgi:hypothetical protein